jgi:myo-inositol-1(or 4)-monophosphatase
LWLIDPIDGTANYARGLPRYCVSIGYLEQGVPTLGAIYDPSHDWLYSAAVRRRRVARRRASRGKPDRGDDGGDCRVRLVDAAQRRRLRCVDRARIRGRCRDAPARARARWGSSTSRPGASKRTANCTSTRGIARPGIVLVREAGGFANDFFAGDGVNAGNPLIATNAALCAKLAAVIGISITG